MARLLRGRRPDRPGGEARSESPTDIDDRYQEAWREIIASLPTYRHDPTRGWLRDWLYTLARRARIRTARRQVNRPFEPLSFEIGDSLKGPESTPWSALERAERREQIGRGLATFRGQACPDEFWVVLLHWICGQTRVEMANRLGLTVGQVRGHLHRARPRLRACLGPEYGREFP